MFPQHSLKIEFLKQGIHCYWLKKELYMCCCSHNKMILIIFDPIYWLLYWAYWQKRFYLSKWTQTHCCPVSSCWSKISISSSNCNIIWIWRNSCIWTNLFYIDRVNILSCSYIQFKNSLAPRIPLIDQILWVWCNCQWTTIHINLKYSPNDWTVWKKLHNITWKRKVDISRWI